VTFVVIVVGMFLVVVAFVITFFVIIREGEWGGDEGDGGCRDGQDISWFHFFSSGFWVLVRSS
jgi:ABC-type cobalt transport system substrate-binding protein